MKPDTDRFPLGSMPVMTDDEGNVYCQSIAIARMVAIKHGYYSTCPMEAYLIDSLVDGSVDVVQPHMGDCLGGIPDEDKAVQRICGLMKVVEDRMNMHGKKFSSGDKLTMADFWCTQIHINHIENENFAHKDKISARVQEETEKFPKFKQLVADVKAELADYLASRPVRPL